MPGTPSPDEQTEFTSVKPLESAEVSPPAEDSTSTSSSSQEPVINIAKYEQDAVDKNYQLPILPPTAPYFPLNVSCAANSLNLVNSSSYSSTSPALAQPRNPPPFALPPMSTLKPDIHTTYQKPPELHHPECYLPDFSDLCQENYNFWQPFFDGPSGSHGATNPNPPPGPSSSTSNNLAELDYLLERAGLYQGCDLYRNQWEDSQSNSDNQQAQVFFQNPSDSMSNRNIYQPPPPPLPYGTPTFPYQPFPSPMSPAIVPQTFPPHQPQSHHSRLQPSLNYGEFLYDSNRLELTHPQSMTHHRPEAGYPIKILNPEQQPIAKQESEYVRPTSKRPHFEENPAKKIHLEDARFRSNLMDMSQRKLNSLPATQQASSVRPVEGNSLLLYAYPMSYPYQAQAPSRNQPIFLQVRAAPEKPLPYRDAIKSKTVKELLLQERSYCSTSSQRMSNAPLNLVSTTVPGYRRWPISRVSESTVTSATDAQPPRNSNLWTLGIQSPATTSSNTKFLTAEKQQLTVESALAGFRVKPGSTVTNVYPIPSVKMETSPRPVRKQTSGEPPKFEALRAALLGTAYPPVINPESIPPFRTGRVNAKTHRPRHFHIERLEIGTFQVDEKCSEGVKAINKLKILFTKRLFVYEFQALHPKTMCCIQVPFSTVSAIRIDDNVLRILVSRQPIMYLGARNVFRPGLTGTINVFDTTRIVDITNGDIKRTPLHKITLRKNLQAKKLKQYLWSFDERFQGLTELPFPDRVSPSLLPPPELDSPALFAIDESLPSNPPSESPQSPKRVSTRLSRPPRRYYDQLVEEEEHSTILICSCRISCRSVRCSCVKASRKCNSADSLCQCSNCDNPLNILESVGVDPLTAARDDCLMQNIYRLMYLKSYLDRNIQLECCGQVVAVRDCIPGIVPCPNGQCSAQLEYSWCLETVNNNKIVPRNHCTICSKCCLRDWRHCLQCNRCYECGGFRTRCPTCGSDDGWPTLSQSADVKKDLK